MKLFQEFKSINHEVPKDRKFIAENDNLEILQKIATKFVSEQNANIVSMWNYPLSDTTSMVSVLRIDDKSELVIRR